MFSRRKKKKQVPEKVPIPKYPGDLWHILQDIAREEDPGFSERTVVEHFNSSAEGHRDVTRWLRIYEMRLRGEQQPFFPPHQRRHRGYVIVARTWPHGILWDAFDEKTLRRATVSGAADEQSLVRALDALLDAPTTPADPTPR